MLCFALHRYAFIEGVDFTNGAAGIVAENCAAWSGGFT
tara:strand:+ start:1219 stop:1332 length:114 start_codon:yes stop_codon:yes gene_type:complete